MLVKDWMTTDPITVGPDTSVMKASQIMKENNVRRLPVVNEKGGLVGIVSDRDLKEASPSKATTLDVHELYYLLSELKIKDIMSRKVLTIKPEDTVEKAAVIMLEHKVTGLPVLEDGQVVGIISQGDVFRVLTTITGIYRGGTQYAFVLEDRPGSIKEVADIIRKHGGQMVSILTSYETAPEGCRNVYFRIADLPKEKQDGLTAELEREFTLINVARDQLDDI
ncbi:MAG: CBS and ACT domain-containing protein [Deltaproteobacteria bacterium]|nr:CBS and ACT domain-containing protein [Deltaproteobacteria bacterium]